MSHLSGCQRGTLSFVGLPDARTSHFQEVLRGASRILVLKMTGLGAAFLCQVLLARWLGVEGFGVYTLALSWCLLLTVPSALGLPTAVVRIVTENLVRGENGKVAGIIRWSRGLTLLVSLMVAAGGMLLVHCIRAVQGPQTIPLMIGLAAIPLMALLQVQTGLARGFGWGLLAYAPDMLLRHVAGILVVGVLFYWTEGVSSSEALLATWFTLLALVIGQQGVLESRLPSGAREAKPVYAWTAWMRITLPLALVAGFGTVTERVDVLMIGMFLQPSDVAYYHAASRLAGLIPFVLLSINALAGPKISSLYAGGNLHELQQTLFSLLPWIFWPSVSLCIAMIGLGEYGLKVFGGRFVEGYPALVILCVSQTINASAGPVLLVLNMTGLQVKSALIFGVTALFNVGANFLLIPRTGIVGAAIATGATLALWNVWMAIVVRRERGLVTFMFGDLLGGRRESP